MVQENKERQGRRRTGGEHELVRECKSRRDENGRACMGRQVYEPCVQNRVLALNNKMVSSLEAFGL